MQEDVELFVLEEKVILVTYPNNVFELSEAGWVDTNTQLQHFRRDLDDAVVVPSSFLC